MGSKSAMRNANTEKALFLAGLYGFEVETITDYQLRFSKDNRAFDYYPTYGKVNWVGTPEYFKAYNLEAFITENFKALSIT